MKVEFFYAEGCDNCAAARRELKQAVAAAFRLDADWHELEVVKHLDYAVELGVLSTPAVAIDGVLVFAKLPTVAQLDAELQRRAPPGHGR